MSKVKITTTIEEDVLKVARERFPLEGFEGLNGLIEKALKFYFANSSVTVWEFVATGGWTRKLIIRPNLLIVENIRSRKSIQRYDKEYYANEENLVKEGWKKTWGKG